MWDVVCQPLAWALPDNLLFYLFLLRWLLALCKTLSFAPRLRHVFVVFPCVRVAVVDYDIYIFCAIGFCVWLYFTLHRQNVLFWYFPANGECAWLFVSVIVFHSEINFANGIHSIQSYQFGKLLRKRPFTDKSSSSSYNLLIARLKLNYDPKYVAAAL